MTSLRVMSKQSITLQKLTFAKMSLLFAFF